MVSIVSDLGGGNRGLHKELEVTHLKPYFINPCNNEKIFVLADVPHLLKLIRNHFVDEGFIINGKEINKCLVEAVLDVTSVSELRITHKMTKEKLNVTGAQRQRVKFASKLFSHTISKAIDRCGTLGHLSPDMNWSECADFFKQVCSTTKIFISCLFYPYLLLLQVNDWFDVFNVNMAAPDARNRNKAYGLSIEEQNQIIDDMSTTIFDLRVKGRKHLLPFQTGKISCHF